MIDGEDVRLRDRFAGDFVRNLVGPLIAFNCESIGNLVFDDGLMVLRDINNARLSIKINIEREKISFPSSSESRKELENSRQISSRISLV